MRRRLLLALFIKRSLSLLGGAMRPEKADFFMFNTGNGWTGRRWKWWNGSLSCSLFRRNGYPVRAGRRAFFSIISVSRRSCGGIRALICDFGGERLKTLLLEVNRHTRPATVTVAQEEHPELERQDDREGDGRSLSFHLRSVSDGRIIDTVYLIGDGFAGEWYPKTLAVMCRNRRVFQGNNLYSKGACYGGKAKRPGGGVSGREYVYLGSDMLRVNVGLLTEKRGKETCLSLLDAGMNWFDARGECEFLLDADHTFTLRLTPVSGKKLREVVVTLSGVPERPPFATRIFLAASCPDAETVRLRMEDRGFGEFFPSSGLAWEESLPLTEVLAE